MFHQTQLTGDILHIICVTMKSSVNIYIDSSSSVLICINYAALAKYMSGMSNSEHPLNPAALGFNRLKLEKHKSVECP